MGHLQLALDTLTFEESLKLLDEVKDSVDIVEIGTPFLLNEGLKVLTKIKEAYPNYIYLADAKIVDGAKIEATDAFEAGADIVTVLGLADNKTVSDVVECAKIYGTKVMVDLINVSDIGKRSKELLALGVDYLCVHTAFDVQDTTLPPLEDLKIINQLGNCYSGVAGGVGLKTIKEIAAEKPAVVVVGGAITNSENPKEIARLIKMEINNEGR